MTEGEVPQRLIEWTGERCVPWADDIQVIYEHYHRYALASRFVAGQRVLDLASGEGYGAAILSDAAREVVGIDIDTASVEHAGLAYRSRPNLWFRVGSITDPDVLADTGQFDVITCFEALEHVDEQAAVVRIASERLRPRGILLVSTPDVDQYTREQGNHNPFHVKELSEAGLRALLGESFDTVDVLRQNVAVGSLMTGRRPADGGADIRSIQRGSDGTWTLSERAPHTYLFALATNGELPQLPDTAVLVDPALTLVERGDVRAERLLRAEIDELRRSREHDGAQLRETAAALERAAERSEQLAAELTENQAEAERQREALARSRAECVRQAGDITALRRAADLDHAKIRWLSHGVEHFTADAARLAAENAELRERESALAQRIVGRYRGAVERWAPRGSRLRDVYERALGRSADLEPVPEEGLGPVGVTTSDDPMATIIIPVHGQWSYTRSCLRAIEAGRPGVPFEVIVVDDASPDDSADRLAACPGLRLLRNPRNTGFVGACNLGARHARGDYLVFLNNDTEVRHGWLDELVDTACHDETVGVVGAMLIDPDGRVQESGGIVWADGSGWNYGRGEDPHDARVMGMRDVDYCSGAALLVRRTLFDRVGGFDTRYEPAYYEDTDLAFAVREAGFRTVVQPRAVVVHHEGVSNGTDPAAGVKQHQAHNRAVFSGKWREELRRHLPEPSPANLWVARQRTAGGHDGGIVLVVDHQVPRPDHDSGSARMRGILELLLGMGRRVVFFAANNAALQPYTDQLRQHGITVITDARQQDDFVRDAGGELRLAILSRPNVAWGFLEQLRACAPDCFVAYDSVDLHFLRLGRQAGVMDQLGDARGVGILHRQAQASRELELGLVRASDLTLAVSEVEQKLLADLVPSAKVEILSNLHRQEGAEVDLRRRSGVLFVGSFDHPPNRDAVRWLTTEIWPLVRKKCTGAVLGLVGENPPADIVALSGEDIVVEGWVADLRSRYDTARLTVAPLRFGAGVKGKVGESLACGVPVVGTSTAFEAMNLRHRDHVLFGDTTEDIADNIVALLTDDTLWNRLSVAGRDAVAAKFGVHAARAALGRLLQFADGRVSPGYEFAAESTLEQRRGRDA